MKCLLAAMDGMTTAAFRSICFEYGADGATTEMIGALGFARAKRKMKPINQALVMRRPEEGFLAAQIIGSEPEAMAEAARRLEALNRFDTIEINMGCPARKVTGSGNGSALLREPQQAGEILTAVCEATKLPVRLKLRLGWDREHITAPEIIRRAEDAGCKSVILHGRTREQFYSGEADIDALRAICENSTIPIFANGAVGCAKDARSFLDRTGAAGICIGRAALKEPWIFADIRAMEAGEEPGEHLLPERIEILKRFAARLVEQKKENFAICEMRKYVNWWIAGFPEAEALCARINNATDLIAFCETLDRYLDTRTERGEIYPSREPITLDTMMHPRYK